MVRVNLIDPRKLADQHLIAEYNEILMLMGHLKKHGVDFKKIKENYCLGKGHITFFKNKLSYLKKRHEAIRVEMRRREFKTNKQINLRKYSKSLINDWKPREEDYSLIKKRLKEKINLKPQNYRYYGVYKGKKFLIDLVS